MITRLESRRNPKIARLLIYFNTPTSYSNYFLLVYPKKKELINIAADLYFRLFINERPEIQSIEESFVDHYDSANFLLSDELHSFVNHPKKQKMIGQTSSIVDIRNYIKCEFKSIETSGFFYLNATIEQSPLINTTYFD